MPEHVEIWGWDGTAPWVPVLVDAAGHLQVDVIAAPAFVTHCYGWDTANWLPLRFEAAGIPNLRTKLYDGANGIEGVAQSISFYNPGADWGLQTSSKLMLYQSVTALTAWRHAGVESDASTGTSMAPVGLWGWNGGSFDRLRTYGTGVLTVAKGAIAPTRIRMTATGRVGVAGAKKLFWLACSPDGPSAEWEITDADAGGGAVVYDHFDADKHSDHIDFNPPMEFTTGIWVEKFDHMKSLVFCYQ